MGWYLLEVCVAAVSNEVYSEMFLIQNYMPIRYITASINSKEKKIIS
jgi:hypothetical protein